MKIRNTDNTPTLALPRICKGCRKFNAVIRYNGSGGMFIGCFGFDYDMCNHTESMPDQEQIRQYNRNIAFGRFF